MHGMQKRDTMHGFVGEHLNSEVEQRLGDGVSQQVGLETKVPQLGAFGIVVVLLCLHAGVGDIDELHIQADLCPRLPMTTP